jgi:hypothetical protein
LLALAALLVVALGTAVTRAASKHQPARATVASSAVQVSVGRGEVGRPIPSGFLGVGLEFRTVNAYAGNSARSLDPVFVQLVKNLAAGQRPIFRIGGISTDRSWWPMRGVRRSPGITYNITRGWIGVLRALATATNARLLLGINLEDNSTSVARAEVHALKAGIGSQRIAGYELGNEPELYTGIAWYAVKDGHDIPWYLRKEGTPVFSRPKGYNVHDFTSDFSRFRRALPHQPLAGPATGNFSWLTDLPQFLSAEPGLRWVTFHRYGLNQCVHNAASPTYPSVPHLLTTLASRGFLQGVGKYVAIAHNHHAGFLLDEMNSVTCNGHPGVSNAFASALWAVDALFESARTGVDGIQIHSFQGNSNGLFDFKQVHGRWVGEVHPIYYGMLMFAQAAPPGSRLLQISAPHSGDLRSWATLARDGTVHVVLINDSVRGASSVRLRVPIKAASATLIRLQAKSAYATGGVTLGGHGFGAQTTTGNLAGSNGTTLKSNAGAYSVTVPSASAAMVTFSPAQTG